MIKLPVLDSDHVCGGDKLPWADVCKYAWHPRRTQNDRHCHCGAAPGWWYNSDWIRDDDGAVACVLFMEHAIESQVYRPASGGGFCFRFSGYHFQFEYTNGSVECAVQRMKAEVVPS